MAIHYDYETRSDADLKKVGGYRYANDPSTRILMFAIRRDEGPVYVWDHLDPHSEQSRNALAIFQEAIANNELIYAHNVPFELAVTRYRGRKDLGLDALPDIHQWRCVLAMCRKAALPVALGQVADLLKLGLAKDEMGKGFIDVFSTPKSVTLRAPEGFKIYDKSDKGRRADNRVTTNPLDGWQEKDGTHNAEVLWDWLVTVKGEEMTVREAYDRFKAYCRRDVEVECLIHKKLHVFELVGASLESFQFNLKMNDRGIPVNIKALTHAQKLILQYEKLAHTRFRNMTGLAPTQGAKFKAWMIERGYMQDNLQAETIEAFLRDFRDFLTEEGLRALSLYRLLNFAALAKVPAMLNAACDDGHVRGTMLWHGARTGRATGKIIQPQNMKKAKVATDLAYQMICEECTLEEFEEFFASPLEMIASCARHFIHHPGREFYDCDFVGVEARLAPWVVDDQDKLGSILAKVDPYKRIATMVFNVPYEEVTKAQRTIAKPVELGCIAHGQPVLTDRGYVPIQEVRIDDLLWDGLAWVEHEGVIYKGHQRVSTYQGVAATDDHQMFVEGRSGTVRFDEAKSLALRLRDARVGRAYVQLIQAGIEVRRIPERIPIRTGKMHGVPGPEVGIVGQFEKRKLAPLRGLPSGVPQKSMAYLADESVLCSAIPMPESPQSSIQRLWREGHRIQVRESSCGGKMDDGESRPTKRERDRSDRQRWSLRTGEFTMGHQNSSDAQFEENSDRPQLRFPARGMALRQGPDGTQIKKRHDSNRDHPRRPFGSPGKTEKLSSDPGTVAVYDIVNAGPRHRFTVNGKLVHNCVYGVAAKGLQTGLAAPPYNTRISLKEAKRIVKIYRENHPKTVAAWAELEDAAKLAITEGKTTAVLNGLAKFGRVRAAGMLYLVMVLPSGRRLYYPSPRIKTKFIAYTVEEMQESEWKRDKGGYWRDEIQFWGTVPGTNGSKWAFVGTYGSRLFENLVQAMGVDCLDEGCISASKDGFDIFIVVHDQALCYDRSDATVKDFEKSFCKVGEWAKTFPLEADGQVVPFYLKDID